MKSNYFKKLLGRLFEHKYLFLLIVLNMIISNVCALYLPSLMADIVDIGIKQKGYKNLVAPEQFFSAEDILQNQISYILKTGAVMLLIMGIIIIISIWTSYLQSKISSKISCSLREDLFKRITKFSAKDRSKFEVSSLLTRCVSDVENVTGFILSFSQILIPPIMAIGGVIMIVIKSLEMSGVVLAGAICVGIMIFAGFKIVTPKIKVLQTLNDKFNGIFKERLTGVSITRIFGNESYEVEKFKKRHDELKNTSLFVCKVMSLLSPIMTVFMNATTSFLLWIGANEINRSNIDVGDMMAFFQYSVMIITSFLVISLFISSAPNYWVSVERVYEVLLLDSENAEGKSGFEGIKIDGIESIEFKNLSFAYEGASECSLKNINFKIEKNSKIGIIGTTGSGKSTLVKLLMGFYDSFSGDILINGKSIKNFDKKIFVENIAYASQNSSIFSGSILSNLKMANDNVSEETIYEYAKIACIDEFINEKGLDFKIERAGKNVSGGQRQRLAILRSLIKDASLYVFDDSFSKLDFKTGMSVRKNLFSAFKEKIFVVISQRIETIKNLDKILVLDKGNLVGFGSHEELFKDCEIYSEMVSLQFGGRK